MNRRPRMYAALVASLATLAFGCSSIDEETGSATSAAEVGQCNPGWLYCGQHARVRGELEGSGRSTGDIYRCNDDRSLSAVETCGAAGCEVRSSGEDDACRGAVGAAGPDLAVFPPRAGSQILGKDARGELVPRNAPSNLVRDPSVEYFVLAAAPAEGDLRVYTEGLRIDKQSGMCETADKIRFTRDGVTQLADNPDLSVGSAGVRKLLRFDAAVLNAGTSAILFGGPGTSVDRSTGAGDGAGRLVDRRLFSYSACHAHDHMSGFATYRLLDTAGAPVVHGDVTVAGRKQGFCIGDTIQYGSGPNQVASLINNRCSDMVLSPGFADVYARQDSINKRFLGGQWIDITNVPAGTYMVEIEANPAVPIGADGECSGGLVKCGETCRLFCEPNYANNTGRATVTIPATPCVPPAINDGNSSSPTAAMSSPDATFRQRLTELSATATVSSTCGAITGAVACEVSLASGADQLTAHTRNGCTLRYRWERYRTGTVSFNASTTPSELEVEQGCAKTYNGQTCSASVASSCYVGPECSPAREYSDVWKDSCGAVYKTRVASADGACP